MVSTVDAVRIQRVRAGKWVTATLLAAVTLAWGFVEPLLLRTVVALGGLVLVIACAAAWSRLDRAVDWRGLRRRRRAWEFDATSLLLLVVVLVGSGRPTGAWFWISSAVVVAAPMAVSAVRTRRPR